MTDIVERLREYASEFGLIGEAADEIERLRAALQRIDGINDNPDIEAVLRAALDEQVAK